MTDWVGGYLLNIPFLGVQLSSVPIWFPSFPSPFSPIHPSPVPQSSARLYSAHITQPPSTINIRTLYNDLIAWIHEDAYLTPKYRWTASTKTVTASASSVNYQSSTCLTSRSRGLIAVTSYLRSGLVTSILSSPLFFGAVICLGRLQPSNRSKRYTLYVGLWSLPRIYTLRYRLLPFVTSERLIHSPPPRIRVPGGSFRHVPLPPYKWELLRHRHTSVLGVLPA